MNFVPIIIASLITIVFHGISLYAGCEIKYAGGPKWLANVLVYWSLTVIAACFVTVYALSMITLIRMAI